MAAAVEGPASYPATLTSEEQGLVARLKAKYSSSNGQGAADPATVVPHLVPRAPAAPTTATAAASFALDVKMCCACGGSGAVVDCYDCRSIQRTCDTCDGSGVNGSSCSSTAATQQEAAKGPAAVSVAAVQQRQIEVYTEELDSLKQRLLGCADEQERELLMELAAQLERHLARLRQWQQGTC